MGKKTIFVKSMDELTPEQKKLLREGKIEVGKKLSLSESPKKKKTDAQKRKASMPEKMKTVPKKKRNKFGDDIWWA